MLHRVSSSNAQDLCVLAYAFDPESMVFAHQYQIVCDLSKHFRHVYVLANEVNRTAAKPENVTTLDLAWENAKPIHKFFNTYKAFLSVYFKNQSFILFSFMTETHSMALGPLTKILKIKHFLWYAHVSYPMRLRIATRFANIVLTSTSESLSPRLHSSHSKVRVIGQMIDDRKFVFHEERNYESKLRWVHVGRIDPSKELETIISLFKRYLESFPMATLDIIGKSTAGNENYEHSLMAKYSSEISSGKITFQGKQSHEQIIEYLNKSDLFIHSFLGSLDKVLVEATLTGISVVTKNNSYLRHFGGLREGRNDNEDEIDFLQKEVDCWLSLTSGELKTIAKKRSVVALRDHSLSQWIKKLLVELKG